MLLHEANDKDEHLCCYLKIISIINHNYYHSKISPGLTRGLIEKVREHSFPLLTPPEIRFLIIFICVIVIIIIIVIIIAIVIIVIWVADHVIIFIIFAIVSS